MFTHVGKKERRMIFPNILNKISKLFNVIPLYNDWIFRNIFVINKSRTYFEIAIRIIIQTKEVWKIIIIYLHIHQEHNYYNVHFIRQIKKLRKQILYFNIVITLHISHSSWSGRSNTCNFSNIGIFISLYRWTNYASRTNAQKNEIYYWSQKCRQ